MDVVPPILEILVATLTCQAYCPHVRGATHTLACTNTLAEASNPLTRPQLETNLAEWLIRGWDVVTALSKSFGYTTNVSAALLTCAVSHPQGGLPYTVHNHPHPPD